MEDNRVTKASPARITRRTKGVSTPQYGRMSDPKLAPIVIYNNPGELPISARLASQAMERYTLMRFDPWTGRTKPELSRWDDLTPAQRLHYEMGADPDYKPIGENGMKRNKAMARKMRGGTSPYARHGKHPNPRDAQTTRDDRAAAMKGEALYQATVTVEAGDDV